METLWHRAGLYLRMIKISHSVFALPFAFIGALLAASGIPSLHQIVWISLAMVGARSGAMGLNRIIDRKIDAANPRTSNREIPAGRISVRDAVIFTGLSFALLVGSAYQLNELCFRLSPLAVAILAAYSYMKRFSWASHLVLGIAIAGAPLGAWIAVRGTIDAEIFPLFIAVVLWLAGFDILYALQDVSFDKSYGLHSIPQRFGVPGALMLARVFHGLAFMFLVVTGLIFALNSWYYVGMACVAVLLLYEHSLVTADDLSKLDLAFFTMNGYISLTAFFFTLVAVITG